MHLDTGSCNNTRCFTLFLSWLVLVGLQVQAAKPVRIATWNLEHLNEDSNSGCIQRADDDYTKLKTQIAELHADVIAIQEVESAKAAHRVFPSEEWEIVMSGRQTKGERNACWEDPNQYLKHQGTGFAINKGIEFQVNDPFRNLANQNPNMRWGTDITLSTNPPLRLLSVHLASGCWTKVQDADEARREVCTNLNYQLLEVSKWVAERNLENHSYIVMGDFNRRLAVPQDWGWKTLAMASPTPFLATKSIATKCDPRFDSIIDHMVVSPNLEQRLLMDTLAEIPRVGEHPDHCAILVDIDLNQN